MNLIMDHLPVLIVAIPLLAAFLVPLASRSISKVIVLLTLIATTMLAIGLWAKGPMVYVFGANSPGITLPSGMTVPIRIMFTVDHMSIFMGLIIATLSYVCMLYVFRFMDRFGESGQQKFYTLFLIIVASMFGMVLTGDLFNMFVFFEIMSISSAAMVGFWTDRGAPAEAAFKYIMVSSVAGIMVLFAIGLLYAQYNVLNLAILAKLMQMTLADKIALAILAAAFAIKAGAVPMHMWIPDAYEEAPAVITALLVVVSQASLYALFRIAATLFGLALDAHFIGWAIIVLGLLSMFIGVMMALPQKDIKRLMAYHAISQTGYMLLGFGAALVVMKNPAAFAAYGLTALEGGLFHIFNHALYKGLLFLTAGAIIYSTGVRDLNDMGGLARRMPLTTIAFIFGALAIAGLPPFNGFASKFMIYESVYNIHPLLTVIAMLVSILTLASFVKVFNSAFLGPPHDPGSCEEVPTSMKLSMLILALLILGIGLFPELFVSAIVKPAALALSNPAAYVQLAGV